LNSIVLVALFVKFEQYPNKYTGNKDQSQAGKQLWVVMRKWWSVVTSKRVLPRPNFK